MAGVFAGPGGSAFAERGTRHLSERLLHRCAEADRHLGRRLFGDFPHHFQGHRCRHQRGHGLYHRPHPHKRGQSPPVAFAQRAAVGHHRHFAVHRAQRLADRAGDLGDGQLQPILFLCLHHLQHEPQPDGAALHPRCYPARQLIGIQSDFQYHDDRHPGSAGVSHGHHAHHRRGPGQVDRPDERPFHPGLAADAAGILFHERARHAGNAGKRRSRRALGKATQGHLHG